MGDGEVDKDIGMLLPGMSVAYRIGRWNISGCPALLVMLRGNGRHNL